MAKTRIADAGIGSFDVANWLHVMPAPHWQKRRASYVVQGGDPPLKHVHVRWELHDVSYKTGLPRDTTVY